MTTTRQFDFLNRQTNVSSSSSLFTSSSAYGLNSAGQRAGVTNTDSTYWVYNYDSLGQVTSGKKYWSDGTPVAGQQFEYTFDDIGNRRSAGAGGDQTGSNLRYQSYTPNNLNQYTSRAVPGYFDVIGTAASNATVTIWTDANNFVQPYRHGEYFRGELQFTNITGSVWASISNVAVLPNGTNADIVSVTSGNSWFPQTPEAFGYDRDGNMTNDGRWRISWDAENRATRFQTYIGALQSRQQITCDYDYRGRRTQKIVYDGSTLTYIPTSTNRFVYDCWNLIAILNETNGLVSSFTWGTNASGTLQGAGGVGGLLSMTIPSGDNAGTYLYVYDGNFNVVALVDSKTGYVAAQYEYGPFGELIRSTGPVASANPFLFSTKFRDPEDAFSYYGYRYYSPQLGRWLCRDPLAPRNDGSQYAACRNNLVNRVDPLGLVSSEEFPFTVIDLGRRPAHNGRGGETQVAVWHASGKIVPCFAPGPRICSFSVHGQGSARVEYWWDYGAKNHEEHHVAINREQWEDMVQEIHSFSDKCMSLPRALCYAGLIEDISFYYTRRELEENDKFDCRSYGDLFGACSRADENRAASVQARRAVDQKLTKCATQ